MSYALPKMNSVWKETEGKDWDKARAATLAWVNDFQNEADMYFFCALDGRTPWSHMRLE